MTVVENTKDNNLKYCECGCKELILCIDKYKTLRRFKKGHQLRGKMKGENNPMFGVRRFGKDSPHWKGGMTTELGYKLIYSPEHPNRDYKNRVRGHREIMEKHLGRYLTKEEVVHHINGNKDDNRIENLMLFANNSEHVKYEITKDMSNRICLLCSSKKTPVNQFKRPIWSDMRTDLSVEVVMENIIKS